MPKTLPLVAIVFMCGKRLAKTSGLGGTGEETIITSVGEGIGSTIGSAA